MLALFPIRAQADYPLSSLRGELVVNEVLARQSAGNTIAENDEFIELYNAGSSSINLTQLRIIDGNLFTNDLDGTVGSITGNTAPFTFNCMGAQVCEGSKWLPPKAYAVVWVGQKSTRTSAAYASFQAWLRNAPKLNDTGDDVWLYEQTASGLALVDYVAIGTGSGINSGAPSTLWDAAYSASLSNVMRGQSVSLGPNGQLSQGACWEPTASGTASTTCPTYLPTLDTDNFGTRLTSVGLTNTQLHSISGRVFHDANVNGLDDSEAGLSHVVVVLYDVSTASCKSTRTSATGGYRFNELTSGNYTLYETTNLTTACPPAPRDPNQYLSSSANQLTITVANQSVTGLNFADVRMPSLITDNSAVIQPNSVSIYPHHFQAYTAGQVTLSLDSVADPVLSWSSQLYRDVNCNQTLDTNDTPLSTSLSVAANETVCLLVKVISPAHVASGASYQVSIHSSFLFGDASLLNTPVAQANTDLTTVSADLQGAGNLVLSKSVWNVTRNSVGSLAKPNEVLRYTLQYHNTGNGRLNSLALYDVVPKFAVLVGTPQCMNTPSSLGVCQVIVNNGAISWSFTGTLQAGEQGIVSFEVEVD
ncbi:lamin tail domain-containing protein [Thiolinea disciformis]|uniref:lamin tail domain-containing protein n=1 Tax=Thiolinea disciformis TaxID=125614 RepID=UPI00146152C1|nr:SdrD B-like domain-containing protein [Thiolinea disciformis]